MPGTFSSLVVASTNDFPGTQNESIKRWVEANGGIFLREINDNVTHLICSKKAWKQYHPMVKAARHARSIAIVSFDWLEDSLCSKSRKPKDVTRYAFEAKRIHHVIAAQKKKKTGDRRKAKARHKMEVSTDGDEQDDEQVVEGQDEEQDDDVDVARKRDDCRGTKSGREASSNTATDSPSTRATSTGSGASSAKNGKPKANENRSLTELTKSEKIELSGKEFDAECAIFEKDMAKSGYKPFVDSNGFIYLITLVRKDVLRNRLEKHRLKLFEYIPESTGQAEDAGRAKEYACYTVFSTAGKRDRAVHTLAPPGSNFDFAWTMFRGFFKRKVGVDWENREAGSVKFEGDMEVDGGCVGGEDGTDDNKFRALGLLRWKKPSEVAASHSNDVSAGEPTAVVVINRPAFEEHHLHEQARSPDGGW